MTSIKIIGTSHIAPESVKKVEKVIVEDVPDIVAIELDRKRLVSLTRGERKMSIRDARRVGIKGWLFALIGSWIERKLGSKVGVMPGDEMLRAVGVAQRVGARLALIDQDIEITLRRFSASLTWKEKWRFLVDIVKGFVFRRGIEFDLSKVPPKELIEKLLGEVKVRYPNVHRVLVEERNVFMARALLQLAKRVPEGKIIAVVGAGHEDEIRRLLKMYLKQEMLDVQKRADAQLR